MTLDLHLDKKYKADEYTLWIRRTYQVSSILSIPYEVIWNMTEHEFLILEAISNDELKKSIEKADKLKRSQK